MFPLLSMKLVNEIKALEKTKPREYRDLEEKYNSIYLHTDSYQCALMAAGSLLNVVDSVMTDEVSIVTVVYYRSNECFKKQCIC